MLASPGRSMNEAVGYALDDNYQLTPKMDGTRLAIEIDGNGRPHGWSRNGETTRIPGAVAGELGGLAGVTLDGELLGDTYVVFDAPVLPVHGMDAPLHERRSNLETLYRLWQPGPAVRLAPAAVCLDDKADMIARVDRGRGEGLVAKHLGSGYQPGVRSKEWIKLKRHHSVDCEVVYLGTEKKNMGLVVYRDGVPVDVGECGRLTGDGPRVKVGDVVEVRVLYATENGRLVQPTLPRLRGDKTPAECTWDQIEAAATNKNLVLEMTA